MWLLKNKDLSPSHRALILNHLLEDVQALPIKDTFTYDLEGTIKVNGKSLDKEQVMLLRDGAVSLGNNWTYRLIKDQILYEAIKMGVHSSLSMEMILMSKAAIWIQEQEKKIIASLGGREDEVV